MTTLELFTPENVERVLCVVAHPDDMEYGGSAAVAEWTAQGIEVSYLLLTAGEAGIRGMAPEVVRPMRAAEQRAACDIVGVSRLTILDFADGLLEPNLTLREAICREIRIVRPQVVVTMSWELEAGWGLNHVDHRATGISVVDAIRDADNPWLFTDQLASGELTEWKAPWLCVTMHQPSHAIEVSEASLERGVASLEAHRDYLAALPDHPAPRDLITGILTGGGEAAGVPLALPIHAYAM